MRVFVTGATGFIGQRLVPELVDAGHDVQALTRSPREYNGPDAVEVIEGDVLEPATYEKALAESNAAYYLIHSLGIADDFAERDRRAAHQFVHAARNTSLERVIYLGGLGSDRITLSSHLKSRRETETVLREGDFELTALRAAIIIGQGNPSFEMIRRLAERLPIAFMPQWNESLCQPIALDDAIAYLHGALETPETASSTYEVGGPEQLTFEEVILRTAAALDHRMVAVRLPLLTPRFLSVWVALLTGVDRDVARPLLAGLENNVVVEDRSIESAVPIDRTTFETAVRRAATEGN